MLVSNSGSDIKPYAGLKMNRILTDLLAHIVSTALLSVFIYMNTSNLAYVCIFILGSIFIDLDHLVDYFVFSKSKFSLTRFFRCEYLDSGKVYLFLHSWELTFIILLIGLNTGSPEAFWVFAGFSVHLATDNMQRKNLLFYFLIYRFIKQFRVDALLPEFKDK